MKVKGYRFVTHTQCLALLMRKKKSLKSLLLLAYITGNAYFCWDAFDSRMVSLVHYTVLHEETAHKRFGVGSVERTSRAFCSSLHDCSVVMAFSRSFLKSLKLIHYEWVLPLLLNCLHFADSQFILQKVAFLPDLFLSLLAFSTGCIAMPFIVVVSMRWNMLINDRRFPFLLFLNIQVVPFRDALLCHVNVIVLWGTCITYPVAPTTTPVTFLWTRVAVWAVLSVFSLFITFCHST